MLVGTLLLGACSSSGGSAPVSAADAGGPIPGTGTPTPDAGGISDAADAPEGLACEVADAGTLPGITHATPPDTWIIDAASVLADAGPYRVRSFDACAATDDGEPSACADTIDYVDGTGRARRLPYRVTAPRDLPPGATKRPIVVGQHGGGPNPKGQRAYSNLAQLLASHGFVVVQTAVMPTCDTNQCRDGSPERAKYCALFGQMPGADCNAMNTMYYSRPNDFKATLDALPRVLRTVDALAGTRSLGLAALADPRNVAVMGHSAGSNGVLSLAGGGFDYVRTPAGTDVDQRDRFPSAFVALGPNASTSDGGRGWDATGFAKLAADVPMLFVTGSRDYAVDVAACERPEAFMAAGPGHKWMQYTLGGTHASIALNDEDDPAADQLAASWSPDRCAPRTSPSRGGDTFGPAGGAAATTTALESAIFSATARPLVSFLRAELEGDSASRDQLAAAPENTGTLAGFDFATTHLERRGRASPSAKILAPRSVRVSGDCGGAVLATLVRRGVQGEIAVQVDGLPAPATARAITVPAGSSAARIAIDRAGAPAGEYRVRLNGSASEGPVLGTEIRVRFP